MTTRGFRDVLEIARQSRQELYRLDVPPRPAPLVPRHLRFEVTERVLADGRIAVALAEDELPALAAALRASGVEAVAVCLLHAYAHPAHEARLRAALEGQVPFVSVSHEINAEFREYERTSTTALNAAVMPIADRYLADLEASLARGGVGATLHLLQSSGGMMSAAVARRRPLAMAVSGPAGGVAASRFLARAVGLRNAIAFDMGGTTTDVCLIADGRAETLPQRRLGGHPVRLPSVGVESIGAGGGSLARAEGAGLRVGPESAGARPGPACYGLGGTLATVTDAHAAAGTLRGDALLGEVIRVDAGRARTALEPVAQALGLGLREAAAGVLEVANAAMRRAIRLISVQRGHDLRSFALIAYGGRGTAPRGPAGAGARHAGRRRPRARRGVLGARLRRGRGRLRPRPDLSARRSTGWRRRSSTPGSPRSSRRCARRSWPRATRPRRSRCAAERRSPVRRAELRARGRRGPATSRPSGRVPRRSTGGSTPTRRTTRSSA